MKNGGLGWDIPEEVTVTEKRKILQVSLGYGMGVFAFTPEDKFIGGWAGMTRRVPLTVENLADHLSDGSAWVEYETQASSVDNDGAEEWQQAAIDVKTGMCRIYARGIIHTLVVYAEEEDGSDQ